MWDSLPLDLWLQVPASQRDIAALACTCRQLRGVAAAMAASRRLRLKSQHAGMLAEPRWAGLRDLMLTGTALRYGRPAPEELPMVAPLRLAALQSLTVRHCTLAPGFWPAVFDGCPALRHVAVLGDFYMKNYVHDVRHAVELITHGAPRLQRLDIEGSWLVLYPWQVAAQGHDDVREAVRRAQELPPVASDTLREYRAGCRQAPVGVDAALDTLVVDEGAQPPYLVGRMGPRTLAHTRKLVWRCAWPMFDAAMLAPYAGLREADVSLAAVSSPSTMARCLRTLAELPAGLRQLTLRLDVWMMRTYQHDFEWGRPLAHLAGLESLAVEMLFPVESTPRLLAEWLGVGDSVTSVRLDCEESAADGYEDEIERLVDEEDACSDDETVLELRARMLDATELLDPAPLLAWLDARPACSATIRNVPTLRCSHPRLRLLA